MPSKKICFDRVLPQDLHRPMRLLRLGPGGRFRAIAPIGKTWINGSTLRIGYLGGTAQQRAIVQQFAPQWTQHANVQFQFGDVAGADIRIAFLDDGAWSYVGTDAKHIPANQPTMNFGWLDEGVVLHEFGHALGLSHEHQSPNGGIQWNEAAVIADLSGPPNFWDEPTIRHNVLEKYAIDQIHGTEFDAKSIMLYSFPAAWTVNGFHTEPNDVLSDLDKLFIAGEHMYPGRGTPVAITTLSVANVETVSASIGQPGEEDVFRFRATNPGRYIVETTGATDLVMKLFGPDSQTSLVAADDDSGVGSNPRIEASLQAGDYFVQVRHYNQVQGTGQYGIRVFR